MVTDGNQTCRGDHFVLYRNMESLCCAPGTNIVLQVNYTSTNKTKKTYRKRYQICVKQMQGVEGGGTEEGGEKLQTSGYKINKYQGYNIQHD